MVDSEHKQKVKSQLEEWFSDRIYVVEDDRVWVSGVNAHCLSVADRMARHLVSQDVPCGLVHDDDAVRFGGVQFMYGELA